MLSVTTILKKIKQADLLNPDDIGKLQELAKKSSKTLYDIIREEELLPDDVIGQIMADAYGTPFIDLHKRSITEDTIRIIPEVVARHQKMIPFRQDDQHLFVALFDPQREDMLSYLEKLSGKKIKPYFATKENINTTLSLYRTSIQQDIEDALGRKKTDGESIIKLLNTLLEYASLNRASDIHLEPHEASISVRFRIDGELHDAVTLPIEYLDELITRIKILARLRTDEHRSAQDGRFHFAFEDQEADVRVSVVPITQGEKIVMRILSDAARRLSLEELGMESRHLEIISKVIKRPYGMILVTGPTGSGKTTTLYAILKKLNSRKVNISTIEDPVEYGIDGINQIQVNPKTNLTFAHGLKAILRQDPDIIMVGEIRDNETARIAINAAMTGHLVLSTLHTNDAATALPRLLDMGIEPFIIASTVNLIIAQRLVRKINTSLMESYLPSTEELERLTLQLSPQEKKSMNLTKRKTRFFKPKESNATEGREFEGRIGIFEMLEVNEDIRSLIMQRANSDNIISAARSHGMHSMFYDGLEKVLEGKTTIDQVLQATHE